MSTKPNSAPELDLSEFDAMKVQPGTKFSPLPKGDYLAKIIGREEKAARTGNGSYLELTFEILAAEYAGRRLWTRLNLANLSEAAVAIARSELSAICRAAGVDRPGKTGEALLDRKLVLTVAKRERCDTGETVNEITGYKPHENDSDDKPF